MTRGEKLKVLGAKPLEWRWNGLLGSRLYEGFSLNPYTKEELEYEIKVKEMPTKGYHTTIKLNRRSGTLVLGEMLSDDCMSDDELKEIAERDFYNRIMERLRRLV